MLLRVKNSKSCGFQNDLAARMAALNQFMSTPGFRQGQDSFDHGLNLARVDQFSDFSEVGRAGMGAIEQSANAVFRGQFLRRRLNN